MSLAGKRLLKRCGQFVHFEDHGDIPSLCKPRSEPDLVVIYVLSERRIPGNDNRRVARGKGQGDGGGTAVSDNRPGRARHLGEHIEGLDSEGACQSGPSPIGRGRDDDLIVHRATRQDVVEGHDQPIHGLRVGSQRN